MENTDVYTKTLIDIGLPENEARVYIAVLSLGETTALQVARVTDIKRTTVYHTIELLKQKGLVSLQTRGLKNFFVAEDPERLGDVLATRAKIFEGILPELSSKFRTKNKEGSVREYLGLKAVKIVYENLLKELQPHDDYCVISNQEDWYKLDAEFFQKFIEKRAKLPINIRLILTDTPAAHEAKKFERNFNEVVKILPKETSLSTNLIVTPHKVIIHRLLEPISALVLTDPTIIQMHKESFEIMWSGVTD